MTAKTLEERISLSLDKEDIRELVLLYARAIDRRDTTLLSDLYTEDAWEDHADLFNGPTKDFLAYAKANLANEPFFTHYICNHLIEVNGDDAEGEVYAIAYYVLDGEYGAKIEELRCLRYLDQYRRGADGRWRFSNRKVIAEMRNKRQVLMPPSHDINADPSYDFFQMRMLQRGERV